VYDAVRPWLARLAAPTPAALNALAEERGLVTESGRPVRFVPPRPADPYYEIRVFETGEVPTRPANRHDLFNALAWLAFPKTKARINALHAAEIPRERGRRGRLRDLLTLFDEGGAIVACGDARLEAMVRAHRWKELFWERRARVLAHMRIHVIGHATLDMAGAPWPGITCKTIFVPAGADPDAAACAWLDPARRPEELAVLPIFGYPGWFPGNDAEAFYDDARYFRPLRRDQGRTRVRP
jgi:hypothetical protein